MNHFVHAKKKQRSRERGVLSSQDGLNEEEMDELVEYLHEEMCFDTFIATHQKRAEEAFMKFVRESSFR